MAIRTKSLAQRANEITFFLKGHIKNEQISYLRVARALAQIRDEKMFAALKHKTIEEYAQKRLRLGRAAMYRYLQVYDWVREFHPGWLAKKPKGFIPQISDAFALMSIDRWLKEVGGDANRRRTLEKARRKALDGELSKREFEALTPRGPKREDSLRAIAASLRSIGKRARRLTGVAPELVRDLDAVTAGFQAAAEASRDGARLVAAARVEYAKRERREAITFVVRASAGA